MERRVLPGWVALYINQPLAKQTTEGRDGFEVVLSGSRAAHITLCLTQSRAMIKGPFEIVKLPPEHERSIVGAWKIDFPGVPMTRTIELVAGQYYLVSRLLDKDGARVGGEDGLLLQKVSENEYRGTGKNQSTYKLTADGRFEQFVVGDREPSMVGSPTDQLWPQ